MWTFTGTSQSGGDVSRKKTVLHAFFFFLIVKGETHILKKTHTNRFEIATVRKADKFRSQVENSVLSVWEENKIN